MRRWHASVSCHSPQSQTELRLAACACECRRRPGTMAANATFPTAPSVGLTETTRHQEINMSLRRFSGHLAGVCVGAVFALAGVRSANAQGFGNPVVIDTGRHVTGVDYDPWNDQVTVSRHRDLVRASAWDPARGYVDPGSLHYVDRYVRDQYGRLYREQ